MIVLVVSMLVLLVLGVPIGYAIGISALIYVALISDMSVLVVVQQISSGADTMVLLALPFFLLAGEIMNAAGITRRLTRLALAFIGPLPGGLSYVVVIANMLVAMVSGAAIASAAAVGSTMVPMMEKKGYPKGFAAALNASSATIGPVIPPSIGFIIYASVSGTSVGKLFLAGTLPGILIALVIMAVCTVVARRSRHPKGERHSVRELAESFWVALPGLLMPVIILGGIFGGLVTPTEAGVLAVAYGLVVGFFVYRSLRLTDLPRILLVTARRSTSILFIIACASCFGFLISREVEAEAFVGFFQAVTSQRWLMMLLLVGLILLLGTVMEGGSIMIIFTPLLLPILASYEIDPVHFGVVFQLAIMIGLLTPPVGILLFVMAGVSQVSVKNILANLWPFYAALTVVVLIVAFVPDLSLWLVDLWGGQIK
ncbi:MAG: TRAP transporter large permease [Gammaproteobacteria bacterium]|nr:TRAP transporter large permease [Gammaproteobacteria bacterium]